MRATFLTVWLVLGLAAAAPAGTITGTWTSFYVFGDSLSDDGNINGLVWRWTTGGDPYSGNWRDGGTFTNGDVWNEPLQNEFRNAGRDADNYAVGRAQASGGNWLIPDLDGQIDKLFDYTTRGERGPAPLASIWIGANRVIDELIDGGDAIDAARSAAASVIKGARRLARDGDVKDFVIFNLPNLGRTPLFRLFERDARDAAVAASKEFKKRLANGIASLEADGLNVVDINIFKLFNDVLSGRVDYGFADLRLPCVFPSASAADEYGQPTRCDSETAKERLFIDELHPNATAHRIIGDFVADQLASDLRARRPLSRATLAASAADAPAAVPAPASAPLLACALGVLLYLRSRRLG